MVRIPGPQGWAYVQDGVGMIAINVYDIVEWVESKHGCSARIVPEVEEWLADNVGVWDWAILDFATEPTEIWFVYAEDAEKFRLRWKKNDQDEECFSS
jgi:hypothetical protein